MPPEDATSGGAIFAAPVPGGGDYRPLPDFTHEGTVRTAVFTVHAEAAGHSR
ncbi:UNVERIFIED_ORG: hypothetical protein FHR35_005063 [Microbispora rosea subsp. rosea]